MPAIMHSIQNTADEPCCCDCGSRRLVRARGGTADGPRSGCRPSYRARCAPGAFHLAACGWSACARDLLRGHGILGACRCAVVGSLPAEGPGCLPDRRSRCATGRARGRRRRRPGIPCRGRAVPWPQSATWCAAASPAVHRDLADMPPMPPIIGTPISAITAWHSCSAARRSLAVRRVCGHERMTTCAIGQAPPHRRTACEVHRPPPWVLRRERRRPWNS